MVLGLDLPRPEWMTRPPSRDQMLRGHAIEVDRDRWQRLCQQAGLPTAGGVLEGDGRAWVSRHDVLVLADAEPTSETVWQLLYGALAWGLGLKASRVTQRLHALAQDQERYAGMLLDAWWTARSGGPPAEAYRLLIRDSGQARIPWLGAAFATKFLYFAQGTQRPVRCLILDSVVSGRLSSCGWTDAPSDGWWPQTYATYCDLLRARSAQLEPAAGEARVEPDQVEYMLFQQRDPGATPSPDGP